MNFRWQLKLSAIGAVLVVVAALSAATNNSQLMPPSLPVARAETGNTLLGRLPKPLKIFRTTSGNFFGITSGGEKIMLSGKVKLNPDPESNIFFDKYGDRIFFYQNRRLQYYDLNKAKVELLPKNIGSTDNFNIVSGTTTPWDNKVDCLHWTKCVEVAGVYRDYIVLGQTKDAAAGNMTIFNMTTGKKLSQRARVLSSEYTQAFQLFLNGKSYQLILDSKTQKSVSTIRNLWSKSRSFVNTSQPHLSFYLEEKNSDSKANVDNSYNPERPSLWHIVFGIGRSPALNKPSPIFKLPTKRPENVNSLSYERTFRIRTLFQIERNKLAIEVDNGIVIIDLPNRQARYTEDERVISQLMKEAIPLAPPIDNNFDYYTEGYCDDTLPFPKNNVTPQDKFVFCLE